MDDIAVHALDARAQAKALGLMMTGLLGMLIKRGVFSKREIIIMINSLQGSSDKSGDILRAGVSEHLDRFLDTIETSAK